MTLTLPDDVRAQAERQAKAAGFASVGEYVADLVREDVQAGPPPDQYAGRTREELERLLNEGMAGVPVPGDEQFWEERRRKMIEYAAKRGVTS